jgi:hypothetical protein
MNYLEKLKVRFRLSNDTKRKANAWKKYCHEYSNRRFEDIMSDYILDCDEINEDFIRLGYSASDVSKPSFVLAFPNLYEEQYEDMVWKEIDYKEKYYGNQIYD